MAAHLGSFNLALGNNRHVVPGSDSGWNKRFTVNSVREILTTTDFLLNMSSGSAERSFTLRCSPEDFRTLRDTLYEEIVEFEDWSGDVRNVLVFTVERVNGSRPFRVVCKIELIEVPS